MIIITNIPPFQILRDGHLILIILGVTGIGVLLLIVRSATDYNPPVLIPDEEHLKGVVISVSVLHHLEQHSQLSHRHTLYP